MFSYLLYINGSVAPKEFTFSALHINCPLTEKNTRCSIRRLTLCADQLAGLSNAEKTLNCRSPTWDLFTPPVGDNMCFIPGFPGISTEFQLLLQTRRNSLSVSFVQFLHDYASPPDV